MSWENEYKREFTCKSCCHIGELTYDRKERCMRNKCEITNRWGKYARGHYCNLFEHNKQIGFAADGIPLKNTVPIDYRTESQWEKVGRQPIANAKGKEMYPSIRYAEKNQTFTYYRFAETEEIKKC